MPRTHRTPTGKGRERGRKVWPDIVTVYRLEPERAVFVRVSGHDEALPERLLVRAIERNPFNIPAPFQLLDASSKRHLSGLWAVASCFYRGSIILDNGDKSTFTVRNWSETDGATYFQICRKIGAKARAEKTAKGKGGSRNV